VYANGAGPGRDARRLPLHGLAAREVATRRFHRVLAATLAASLLAAPLATSYSHVMEAPGVAIHDRARVGVISDTHGVLRPEAVRALRGVDLILHAGDIGRPEVLGGLRALARVVAVRGNNDGGPWARTLRERETVSVAGVPILVLHDVKTLQRAPAPRGVRVVVAGHSHRPSIEERDGMLFLNPGSAGPRRFALPVSIATLLLRHGRARARLVTLAV
jgi:putative phosphoesterase